MRLIEMYQSLQTIQKKYLHLIKSYNLNFEAYPEIHKFKKSQVTGQKLQVTFIVLTYLPTYLSNIFIFTFL